MSSQNRMQVIYNHLNAKKPSLNLNRTAAYKYKYTVDNSILSEDQRKFYEDNGYLLIKNLVGHSLLDECKQRFINICEGRVPRGTMTLMKDVGLVGTDAKGENLTMKVQDFVWDDVLSKYIIDENVLNYVEAFTGPNISAIHAMLINKPPNSRIGASRHPMHQDLHYFPFRPAERMVASWTAMESIYKENGCLFVVPGSHKGMLQAHDYPDDVETKSYHGVKEFGDAPAIDVIMDKGDTIFFHPLILHGSGPNKTKGFRKAISCHYADSNCYFIDVKGTSQEEIGKVVEEMALKRRGVPVTFEQEWKYKSRCVRGQEGNFKIF